MRSINENIINSFKILKIIFCLNKEYASRYNLIFTLRKLIIIRKFSFFYIINVNKNAIEKVFKDISSIYFYFIKKFKIEFIAR